MKAQQHWHKLDRDLVALKAAHAAEVQGLKQGSSAWEGKCREESRKLEAAGEQLQRQEEKMQGSLAEKEKAFTDMQDAVKV